MKFSLTKNKNDKGFMSISLILWRNIYPYRIYVEMRTNEKQIVNFIAFFHKTCNYINVTNIIYIMNIWESLISVGEHIR